MAESRIPDQAADYQAKTEKLTHVPQIIGLLKRLREQRVPLTVRVPGQEGLYNSLLLQVDTERGFILLDELNPPRGHELLCEARRLRVYSQCQGVELSFAANVEIGTDQRGVAFYRSPIPDSVDYLQRRGNYRVRMGLDLALPVQMTGPDGAAFCGELFDLSLGGISAIVDSSIQLERGQSLSCTIQPPKGDALQVELDIRFIQQADPNCPTRRFGASFRALDNPRQQAIRRLVAQLEREMLRRKAQR